MEDVRRIPGTVRRNGVYYLQRRVPAELVEAFGVSHFKKSLETRDPNEAKRRLNAANVCYDEIISAKRDELQSGSSPYVPPVPLKLLALRTRLREYVASETAARTSALGKRRWKLEPGSRAAVRAEIAAAAEALRDPADDFTRKRMREVAVALVPENRFDRPEFGPIHNLWHPINGPFRIWLRRALLEVERKALNLLDGDYSGAGLDAMYRPQMPASWGQAQPAAPAATAAKGITLAELSAARLADHAKGTVRTQRKAQLAAAHALILRYFGADTLVSSFTPAACSAFRDLLSELPRDLTKRFLPDAPLADVATQTSALELPTMARSTQETYLGALRDLMEWGVREWSVERNPAAGLKSLTPDRPRARIDFDEEQLKRICLEPFMRGLDRRRTSLRPHEGLSEATRYWVPRIALYSGMRQNEICQLDVTDIRRTGSGVHYFLVSDDSPGKQLKNAASRKAVPIHFQLRDAGLLNYVAAVERAGHQKLFPDLTASKFGHYGAKVSKWINRQFRSAGYPRGVDFHAFRHTFAQALRHADVPSDVAARLGGWSTNTGVMGRYGGALSDRWIEHLDPYLQKVHFGAAEPHIF